MGRAILADKLLIILQGDIDGFRTIEPCQCKAPRSQAMV
jgi:hypothetical protein